MTPSLPRASEKGPTRMSAAEARLLLAADAPRKNKYRNTRTTVDGIKFASKREAARYADLKRLERAGEITALRLQPRYPLTVNGMFVTTYVGDFEYVETSTNRLVTEDSKGVRTRDFINKAKLFHALYGREVHLV